MEIYAIKREISDLNFNAIKLFPQWIQKFNMDSVNIICCTLMV